MVSIQEQLDSGRLVCPATRQALTRRGTELVTADGLHRYPVCRDVPLLLSDPARQAQYLGQDQGAMVREYTAPPRPWVAWVQHVERRLVCLGGDHRSAASVQAFERAVASQPAAALCVSVGGGPSRAHPGLTNLNIGPFPNVDVVADAHQLPYADGVVDAIHCEAVLEHLEFPDRAVVEMARVLKPGGHIFCVTPFIHGFHGYPNHFQNFTLIGHRRLFERAGLTVTEAGTCVGPTMALSGLLFAYCRDYVPTRILSIAARGLAALFTAPLRPIDRRLNRRESSHLLATTTFVLATKEQPGKKE